MSVVTLIGRDGCHLCDDARVEVLAARSMVAFELVELDVDTDPELRAEYGYQVPVVLLDGEMFSYFDADRHQLAAAVTDAERSR